MRESGSRCGPPLHRIRVAHHRSSLRDHVAPWHPYDSKVRRRRAAFVPAFSPADSVPPVWVTAAVGYKISGVQNSVQADAGLVVASAVLAIFARSRALLWSSVFIGSNASASPPDGLSIASVHGGAHQEWRVRYETTPALLAFGHRSSAAADAASASISATLGPPAILPRQPWRPVRGSYSPPARCARGAFHGKGNDSVFDHGSGAHDPGGGNTPHDSNRAARA